MLLLISSTVLSVHAQDTTRIQAFTFDDITKRRGWYNFPDGADDYRKIIMNYTLKCDQATTADNFACGEWDYTTYTDIFSYQNVGTPYYFLSNTNPDTIQYLTEPQFDYYQYYSYFPVFDMTNSEEAHDLLSGTESLDHVLASSRDNGRAQYILTAAELSAMGVSAGEISKMRLNLTALGSQVNALTIRMANTLGSSFTTNEFIELAFHTAFDAPSNFNSTGLVELPFYAPFTWDGSSNILLDISFENQDGTTDMSLQGGETSLNGLVSTRSQKAIDFAANEYIEVPTSSLADIDQEITVAFWAYGDPNEMPFNTYAFEGVDAENRRVVNCHLPWSNGQVYWDAGHDMTSSYDRINATESFNDFAGNWTHWAFTKNATTGDMAYYVNGELAMSGTGMTRSMAGIERFKIGGSAGNLFGGRYDGMIDEFQVWTKSLSQETISEWMTKSVDASHPDYSSLALYYDFEGDSENTVVDQSPNGTNGTMMGLPSRVTLDGSEIFMNVEMTLDRPDITLVQGSYDWHLDSTLLSTAVAHQAYSLIETTPYIDQAVSGMSYTYQDTSVVFLAEPSVTYAPDGSIVSETPPSMVQEKINLFKETRHQIQNYVTPYGIQLDLGANGFRWQYEVTDYQPVLEGLIEIRAGNQQELIDLEFEFIHGTPPRDIVDFQTLWLGDFSHTSIADDENIQPMEVTFESDAQEFRIKHRTTGHWFGGFNNCAEFCPKDFHIDIDGNMEFQWENWTTCADNPVIDQGGTWIYDRAGWCPGAFADTYDHEITPFVSGGSTHIIDFGMEAYPSAGGEGNYRTTGILIQYAAKNFQVDGEIEDIVSPNNWEYHNRYNPVCMDPVVTIRNLGAEEMTSAVISYQVSGGTSESFEWSGSLMFNESEDVTLPISGMDFWNGDGTLEFIVELTEVNGAADEHAANNIMKAPYDMPTVYTQPFLIWLRTNLAPQENEYWVYNSAGDVVLNVDPTEQVTQYRDTLDLPNGCYHLRLEDTGEDGLDFFANSDGTGFFRTKLVGGVTVENWNPGFGSFINHYFVVDNPANGLSDMQIDDSFVNIYPNPSKGLFNLNIETYLGSELNLEIFDAQGKLVHSFEMPAGPDNLNHLIDLSGHQDGIYFLKLMVDQRQIIKKLIKE